MSKKLIKMISLCLVLAVSACAFTGCVPTGEESAPAGEAGSALAVTSLTFCESWDLGGLMYTALTPESRSNYGIVYYAANFYETLVNYENGNIIPGLATEWKVSNDGKVYTFTLRDGYETIVGEGGSTLSGGERQRISIARAMLKDAPIVLLDEATASVDPDNEKYIQEAISELVRDKTLIIIAHRLSTIKSADQILVLDEGEIVQRGRHDELISQEGVYQNLWRRRMQARSWRIGTNAGIAFKGEPS